MSVKVSDIIVCWSTNGRYFARLKDGQTRRIKQDVCGVPSQKRLTSKPDGSASKPKPKQNPPAGKNKPTATAKQQQNKNKRPSAASAPVPYLYVGEMDYSDEFDYPFRVYFTVPRKDLLTFLKKYSDSLPTEYMFGTNESLAISAAELMSYVERAIPITDRESKVLAKFGYSDIGVDLLEQVKDEILEIVDSNDLTDDDYGVLERLNRPFNV